MPEIKTTDCDMSGEEAEEKNPSEPVIGETSAENAAEEAKSDTDEVTAPLRAEIDQLQARIKMLEDALKRERADFINYRQRVIKDLENTTAQAKKKLVSEITQLSEAFLLTDKGLKEHKDYKSLAGAYGILRGHFDALLKKWEVEIIGKVGEPFDPAQHEALTRIEDKSVTMSIIREVIRPGFALPGLVIKPAHVVVAEPPAKKEENATEADDNTRTCPEDNAGDE